MAAEKAFHEEAEGFGCLQSLIAPGACADLHHWADSVSPEIEHGIIGLRDEGPLAEEGALSEL